MNDILFISKLAFLNFAKEIHQLFTHERHTYFFIHLHIFGIERTKQ